MVFSEDFMGKNVKLFYLFILIFIGSGLLFAQQAAQPKYALVIGNGNYTGLSRLTNPVNDANDIAETLNDLGFTVDKILNGNLDQMEQAVLRLKNRLSTSGDAYGFFFYAGHGVQAGGENYLIPVDASIPSESFLRNRAVSVQQLLDELNNAQNRLNVIVLDACRDNPFGWARSGSRGLSIVRSQPADSIIVYATSAGQVASDGTGRNGLFTGQLLPNLKAHDLEVKEVFNRTGSSVAAVSNRQQVPAIYSQFFENAYLGKGPAAAGQSVAQAAPATQAAIVQPAPLPERDARPARDPKPPRDAGDLSLDGNKVFSISAYPKMNILGLGGDNRGAPMGGGISINFYESYKNYGDVFYLPNSFFFSVDTAIGNVNASGTDGGNSYDGTQKISGAAFGLGALYKIRIGEEQRFVASFGPSFLLYVFGAEQQFLYWTTGDPNKHKEHTQDTHVLPGIGINAGLSFRFNRSVSMNFGVNFKSILATGENEMAFNKIYIPVFPGGGGGGYYVSGDGAGFHRSLDVCLGVTLWWPR